MNRQAEPGDPRQLSTNPYPSARSLRRRSAATFALAAVPIAYLSIFFVWPVLRILGRGLAPGGAPDLSELGTLFTGATAGVIRFTVLQATLSTVLTVALGIPGAWALSRMRFPGRRLVRALVVVPFVLPTVVVGIAFRALLGDGGPLGDLDLVPSLTAILLAHVFFNYAVVVRIVGTLWEHLDPHLEESARVLGAGRIRTFTSVTLPALAPAVAAAAAIVFLFTFTSFGVVLILGDAGLSTIETEIYRQTTVFLNLDTAAALTIVQFVAVVAMFVVTGRMQRRFVTAQRLRSVSGVARRPRGIGEQIGLGANLVLMAVLLGAPIATLVLRSLRTPDGGFGLDSYRNLDEVRRGPVVLVEPLDAALTSVRFALIATLLAVLVGSLAAVAIARTHGRTGGLLDGAMALPLGVSAVAVGFGFLIALDRPPLDLRTSWILVPIAQATVAIPLVIRAVLGRLRAVDPRLREAASVLGASPLRVWREVDLPIARSAVLVGAGFAFAMSLGEFGATVFVARRESTTLPVAIYRLLGQPGIGTFGVAMAASVLLMAITVVAILITDTRRGAF